MKKLFIILVVLGFWGCFSEDVLIADKPSSGDDNYEYAQFPEILEGDDFFEDEGHQYGASAIVNDDNSIDAWFSAPINPYTNNLLLYNSEGASAALPVNKTDGSTGGQHFSMQVGFYAIGVYCPTWTMTNSCLTVALYKWNTDYATSVAGTAVASYRFENYTNMSILYLTNDDKFPAGEYVWQMSDGTDYNKAGAYYYTGSVSGVDSYHNGIAVDWNWGANILVNKDESSSVTGSKVIYRSSTNEGKDWAFAETSLEPSKNLDDADGASVTAPSVVKIGDYYYMCYAATNNPNLTDYNIFACRSTTPNATSWDKWNGTSWGGGSAQPIIANGSDDETNLGIGDPSMLVVDDVIYIYYTCNVNTLATKLVTASAANENWPLELENHGTVIDKQWIAGADRCDVKYRDDLKKFHAIHTGDKSTASSYLTLWESEDGLSFRRKINLSGHLRAQAVSCSLSSDAIGHIDPSSDRDNFLVYAYGDGGLTGMKYVSTISPLDFSKDMPEVDDTTDTTNITENTDE